MEKENEITVIDARDLMKKEKDIQLIDVRSREAFADYSLPGFINIPLSKLSQEIPNLDAKKQTLIICSDGNLSFQALKLLESCAINARVVRGGHVDWKKIIQNP